MRQRPSRLFLGLLFAWLVVVPVETRAGADELVFFNTKSFKFHCPACKWAVRCTRNCVTVRHSQAVASGGVPCKVCGGTCR